MLGGLRAALSKGGTRRSGPVLPLVHAHGHGTGARSHHFLDEETPTPSEAGLATGRSTRYFDIGDSDNTPVVDYSRPGDILKEHMEARLGAPPPGQPRMSGERFPGSAQVETRLGSTRLMIQLDLDILGPKGLSDGCLSSLMKQEQLADLLRVQCNGIEVRHGTSTNSTPACTPQASARNTGRRGKLETSISPGAAAPADGSLLPPDFQGLFSSGAGGSHSSEPPLANWGASSVSSEQMTRFARGGSAAKSGDAASTASDIPRRARPRPQGRGEQEKKLMSTDDVVRGNGTTCPVSGSAASAGAAGPRRKRPMSTAENSGLKERELEELERLQKQSEELQSALSQSLQALEADDDTWSSWDDGVSSGTSSAASTPRASLPSLSPKHASQSSASSSRHLSSTPTLDPVDAEADHIPRRSNNENTRCTVTTPPTASLTGQMMPEKAVFGNDLVDAVKPPLQSKTFSPEYLHAAAHPTFDGDLPLEGVPGEDTFGLVRHPHLVLHDSDLLAAEPGEVSAGPPFA
mmetsp:Transcript_9007/g.23308  ORF Transcript_9007/g.23308 Transcript_9007/m.23308 type:complete len:521 (-) Transcript_9007:153-1715(-)